MKTLLKTSFFALATMLSTCVGQAEECKETVHFDFDKRPWEKGYEAKEGSTSIVEYTLKGENPENWTELVTTQNLPHLELSVNEYYDNFIELLKKSVAPLEVHSKIINKDANSLTFEWWIEGDKEFAQHEWFKVFKTDNSTLILRYTTKKLDDVEKVRDTWEKILNSATVTSEGECKVPQPLQTVEK